MLAVALAGEAACRAGQELSAPASPSVFVGWPWVGSLVLGAGFSGLSCPVRWPRSAGGVGEASSLGITRSHASQVHGSPLLAILPRAATVSAVQRLWCHLAQDEHRTELWATSAPHRPQG